MPKLRAFAQFAAPRWLVRSTRQARQRREPEKSDILDSRQFVAQTDLRAARRACYNRRVGHVCNVPDFWAR